MRVEQQPAMQLSIVVSPAPYRLPRTYLFYTLALRTYNCSGQREMLDGFVQVVAEELQDKA